MPNALYNAFKGTELKELILKKTSTILDNSGRFLEHITYPNCQFYVNIQVHLPIMTDRDFTLEAKVDDPKIDASIPAETISLIGSLAESDSNPPDKIREENNMPVSVAEVTKFTSGMIEVVETPVTKTNTAKSDIKPNTTTPVVPKVLEDISKGIKPDEAKV